MMAADDEDSEVDGDGATGDDDGDGATGDEVDDVGEGTMGDDDADDDGDGSTGYDVPDPQRPKLHQKCYPKSSPQISIYSSVCLNEGDFRANV